MLKWLARAQVFYNFCLLHLKRRSQLLELSSEFNKGDGGVR